jgi:hypothetical protein
VIRNVQPKKQAEDGALSLPRRGSDLFELPPYNPRRKGSDPKMKTDFTHDYAADFDFDGAIDHMERELKDSLETDGIFQGVVIEYIKPLKVPYEWTASIRFETDGDESDIMNHIRASVEAVELKFLALLKIRRLPE